ncbi:hypothetical protein ELUMI_v1c00740 [Williamsoniiplasma luminosum]|uniref:BspA family leucine-rich repeat surface protein n=1 Tax=Williamsoniiplasma luminosum TaxID=214888 RepID=A0A2K8NSH5_9MOLU|nr:BspA family leucine-rich repeat surface protein [Williamsoniiplasma luminosum]ATZ16802.1 hypothetical protein ELUMI_v1c00740 [Williamsoniiplasma luminosum]
MKKLLTIFASVFLVVPTTLLVVSCGTQLISISNFQTDLGAINQLNKEAIIKAFQKVNPNYKMSSADIDVNFDSLEFEKSDSPENRIYYVQLEGKTTFVGTHIVHFKLNLANLEKLKQLINQANNVKKEIVMNDEWFTFSEQIGYAEGVASVAPTINKEAEVAETCQKLEDAIDWFETCGRKTVDLWMLKENIKTAQEVLTTTKKDDDCKKTLQEAITLAQSKIEETKNWNAVDHQDDINKAANSLWAAILAFVIKPDIYNYNVQQSNQKNVDLIVENQTNPLRKNVPEKTNPLVLEDDSKSIKSGDLENTNNTTKQQLETLINKAKDIKQNDKGFDKYAELKKAIGHAQGVSAIYQNELNHPYILEDALEYLQAAMRKFDRQQDIKAIEATENLQTRITEANDALKNTKYKSEDAVKKLNNAVIEASKIVKSNLGISQEDEVFKAIKTLQSAIIKFYSAINVFDLKELNKTIDEANALPKKVNKTEEATRWFNEVIQQTEDDAKNLTFENQNQIKNYIDQLTKAMERFERSPNKTDIKTVIKNKNLDRIPNNDEESIRKAILKKNPDAKDAKFDIEVLNNNNVEITGTWNHFGTINVQYTLIQQITELEYKLKEILNSKMTEFWTDDQLQKAIDDAKFDIKDGIKVQKVNEWDTHGLQKWKFIGQAQSDNEFNYASSIEIYFVKNRDTNSKTIYFDHIYNKMYSVERSAPRHIEEILHIGWDKNGQAHVMPDHIKKVPIYISPKITKLDGLFKHAFAGSVDLSRWDTSHVTSMQEMFFMSANFESDLSNWNTINVTNMKEMFYGAQHFNSDISKWKTDNVTDMTEMFKITMAFRQDLSGWNVQKVKHHENFAIASGIESFPEIHPKWVM